MLDKISESYSVTNNMSDCGSLEGPLVGNMVVDGEVFCFGADDIEGVVFGVEGGEVDWG